MLLGIVVYTVLGKDSRHPKALHGGDAIEDAIDGYERTYRYNSAPIGLPSDVGRMSPWVAIKQWRERRYRRRSGH
jgi:hypothetical protein